MNENGKEKDVPWFWEWIG